MKIYKSIKWLAIILLTGLALLFYGWLEARWVKVTPVVIESGDIPRSFDGKRIAFVSDIHHGAPLSIERVQKLVQRINDLHPDIIILGGDYVSMEKKYIEPVYRELGKLTCKYGVYGVLGNHDYFVSGELSKKMIARTNIKLCDNKSYWLKINKDSIKIGGVDDPDGSGPVLDSTIYDVHRHDFCILISHRPEYVEHINTDKVDLTLSGHTHGGQVTIFGLWAPILPTEKAKWASLALTRESQKYCYGLSHPKPGIQTYITSGIGTQFPHVRFFRRPEIALLELKRK